MSSSNSNSNSNSTIKKFRLETTMDSEYGYRATQKIEEGEVLCRIYGRELSKANKYSIQVGEELHLEQDTDTSNVAFSVAYLNHSCCPNCFIDVEGRALKALRQIKRGEELTFSYLQTEYEMESPFECLCCRNAQPSSTASSPTTLASAETCSPALLGKDDGKPSPLPLIQQQQPFCFGKIRGFKFLTEEEEKKVSNVAPWMTEKKKRYTAQQETSNSSLSKTEK